MNALAASQLLADIVQGQPDPTPGRLLGSLFLAIIAAGAIALGIHLLGQFSGTPGFSMVVLGVAGLLLIWFGREFYLLMSEGATHDLLGLVVKVVPLGFLAVAGMAAFRLAQHGSAARAPGIIGIAVVTLVMVAIWLTYDPPSAGHQFDNVESPYGSGGTWR